MTRKISGELEVTDSRLTLSGQTEEDIADAAVPFTKRQRLDDWLNLDAVQTGVVTIVFIDLLLLTALLLIDLNIIQDPYNRSGKASIYVRDVVSPTENSDNQTDIPTANSLQRTENVLHIIQIVLLSLFLIEVLLRVAAKGVEMIYDKWQVFDCLVVLVTFALYMSLTGAIEGRTVTYSVGYLISLRVWRMGRIRHDLSKPVIRRAQRIIVAHRKACKNSDDRNKELSARTKSLEREVQSLRDSLQKFSKSPPPASYISRSQMSLDTMTSDEEFNSCPVRLSPMTQETLVTVDISSANSRRRFTPNGSVIPGTPRGSVGSFPNGSLPGTPKSCSSSQYCFDNMDGIVSDGSSGKIPDIVEHTQHPLHSGSVGPEQGVRDVAGLSEDPGVVSASDMDEVFIVEPPCSYRNPVTGGSNDGTNNNGAMGGSAIFAESSQLLEKDYQDFYGHFSDNNLCESGIFPGSSARNSDISVLNDGSLPPAHGVQAEFSLAMPAEPVCSGETVKYPSGNIRNQTVYSISNPDMDSKIRQSTTDNVETTQNIQLHNNIVPSTTCTTGAKKELHGNNDSTTRTDQVKDAGGMEQGASSINVRDKTVSDRSLLRPSVFGGDTVQLIKDHLKSGEDLSKEDFAYLNAAFGSLTEEELNEIRRVSQIPFEYGSISILTKVCLLRLLVTCNKNRD